MEVGDFVLIIENNTLSARHHFSIGDIVEIVEGRGVINQDLRIAEGLSAEGLLLRQYLIPQHFIPLEDL